MYNYQQNSGPLAADITTVSNSNLNSDAQTHAVIALANHANMAMIDQIHQRLATVSVQLSKEEADRADQRVREEASRGQDRTVNAVSQAIEQERFHQDQAAQRHRDELTRWQTFLHASLAALFLCVIALGVVVVQLNDAQSRLDQQIHQNHLQSDQLSTARSKAYNQLPPSVSTTQLNEMFGSHKVVPQGKVLLVYTHNLSGTFHLGKQNMPLGTPSWGMATFKAGTVIDLLNGNASANAGYFSERDQNLQRDYCTVYNRLSNYGPASLPVLEYRAAC